MLLSIQSTRDSYNHIRTNINIPWNCEYIKYYVESINTKNILITTDKDYIEIAYGEPGQEKNMTITFENTYRLSNTDIVNKFSKFNEIMDVIIDSQDHKLKIKAKQSFKFTNITHCAGLVTGLLYNIDLNNSITYTQSTEYYEFEIPITDYANKLYLVSKQGQSIQSNIGNHEYTPSVIASVDHIVKDGVPIIVNFETFGKPIKNIVNIDSFKQIELELVDFQYKPVPLMSPMFVTIKVKPSENPIMKLSK